jgi:hypothetical protein
MFNKSHSKPVGDMLFGGQSWVIPTREPYKQVGWRGLEARIR